MSAGSFVRIAFAAAATLVLQAVCFAQQQHRIDGQVLDRGNKPLVGVLITLYRGTTPLPKVTYTNSRGEYAIAFDAGSPISVVRYDLTNWYPSKVENISGARDHRINKVLVSPNDPVAAWERAEIIETLITLRALDVANKLPESRMDSLYGPLLDSASGKGAYELGWKEVSNARAELMHAGTQDSKMYYKHGPQKWVTDTRSDYSADVQASLVDVKTAVAEYAGVGSFRVRIEATPPEGGWKVYTLQFKAGDTLHIYVVGEPPHTPPKETATSGGNLITRTYENLSYVYKIIVHAKNQDLSLLRVGGARRPE